VAATNVCRNKACKLAFYEPTYFILDSSLESHKMECAYLIRFDLCYFFILLENTPLSVVLYDNQIIVVTLFETHLWYYQILKYILQYVIKTN